jgi:TIR domain
MADVIVSYAREDGDFVRTLAAALDANGRTAWIEWTSLLPAAPVRQEIFDAIAEASAVVPRLHWSRSRPLWRRSRPLRVVPWAL